MDTGVQAAEHYDDSGWKPVGGIDPSLMAETTQQPRYRAGPAWSTSSTYTLAQVLRRIHLAYM